MALRGMLTENTDRKDSVNYSERDNPFKGSKEIVCPNCGERMREGSRFCFTCGTRLDESSSADDSIKYHAADNKDYDSKAEKAATPIRYNSDELGTLRKHYSFGYRVYANAGIPAAIGIFFIVRAVQLSEDPYVRLASYFGDDSIFALFFAGALFLLLSMIEFFIKKENYLDIYDYGVRGKGSSGGLLSEYQLRPFQIGLDEIVRVENKRFGLFIGVSITTRSNETRVFIRNGDDAVNTIVSLKKAHSR